MGFVVFEYKVIWVLENFIDVLVRFKIGVVYLKISCFDFIGVCIVMGCFLVWVVSFNYDSIKLVIIMSKLLKVV